MVLPQPGHPSITASKPFSNLEKMSLFFSLVFFFNMSSMSPLTE